MVVQAIKTGAFEFVTKPFAVGVLLDAVRQSLECSRARDPAHAELHALGAGYASIGSDT
jgi:FixJ family two-component response regulator